MIDLIRKELVRLEGQHEIKILLAVESGSRAWGFASTDSDWDVRYIYVHKLDWYLRIDQYKDSQEEILENDIDLAGWEFAKGFRTVSQIESADAGMAAKPDHLSRTVLDGE